MNIQTGIIEALIIKTFVYTYYYTFRMACSVHALFLASTDKCTPLVRLIRSEHR